MSEKLSWASFVRNSISDSVKNEQIDKMLSQSEYEDVISGKAEAVNVDSGIEDWNLVTSSKEEYCEDSEMENGAGRTDATRVSDCGALGLSLDEQTQLTGTVTE